MEYALLTALLLGVVLFSLGWLMVVIKGFQRHPITGLFAFIPILNLIILPSLWHHISSWVWTSALGLLLATGAWLGGAKAQVQTQASSLGINFSRTPPTETSTPPSEANAPAKTAVTVAVTLPPTPQPNPTVAKINHADPAAPAVKTPQPASEPDMPLEALPSEALYHLAFEPIALDALTKNIGKQVRITQKNGRKQEGKLTHATTTSITLEIRDAQGTSPQVLQYHDIREAFVMLKKGGK